MTLKTATADSLTYLQIEALMLKAGCAGDRELVAICVLALGGPAALKGADPGTAQDILLRSGRTQEWGRSECHRAINGPL